MLFTYLPHSHRPYTLSQSYEQRIAVQHYSAHSQHSEWQYGDMKSHATHVRIDAHSLFFFMFFILLPNRLMGSTRPHGTRY